MLLMIALVLASTPVDDLIACESSGEQIGPFRKWVPPTQIAPNGREVPTSATFDIGLADHARIEVGDSWPDSTQLILPRTGNQSTQTLPLPYGCCIAAYYVADLNGDGVSEFLVEASDEHGWSFQVFGLVHDESGQQSRWTDILSFDSSLNAGDALSISDWPRLELSPGGDGRLAVTTDQIRFSFPDTDEIEEEVSTLQSCWTFPAGEPVADYQFENECTVEDGPSIDETHQLFTWGVCRDGD